MMSTAFAVCMYATCIITLHIHFEPVNFYRWCSIHNNDTAGPKVGTYKDDSPKIAV